jgi:hypothetical protein
MRAADAASELRQLLSKPPAEIIPARGLACRTSAIADRSSGSANFAAVNMKKGAGPAAEAVLVEEAPMSDRTNKPIPT